MIFYAKTHIGLRKNNEDCYDAKNGSFFAIVADGMGGHNAGEVASRITVDTIAGALNTLRPQDVTEDMVQDILMRANKTVWLKAQSDIEHCGMGSTATMAVFCGRRAIIGHVGDSRAYLWRDDQLTQLTKDHSYVQMLIDFGVLSEKEASQHPQKNIITRAIGVDPDVEPDVFTVMLYDGDRMLICSDGLNAGIDDEKIATILKGGVKTAPDRLIDAALAGGGSDNITIVIVQMDGGGA